MSQTTVKTYDMFDDDTPTAQFRPVEPASVHSHRKPIASKSRKRAKAWKIILSCVCVLSLIFGAYVLLHKASAKTEVKPAPAAIMPIADNSSPAEFHFEQMSVLPESQNNYLFWKFRAAIPEGSTVRIAIQDVHQDWYVSPPAITSKDVKDGELTATLVMPTGINFPKEMPARLKVVSKAKGDLVDAQFSVRTSNVRPIEFNQSFDPDVRSLTDVVTIAKRSGHL